MHERVGSRKNLRDHASWKLVSQSFVEAVSLISQISVIHSKEMQDGGMKIVDTDAIFDCLMSKLIGGAKRYATFDSASGHPG